MNRVQGSGFGVQGEAGWGRALLLTPPGGAAIAVVRIVGPGVRAFLSLHFSKRPAEGRCVHGTLSDGQRVLDDPVVMLHPGGLVADIDLHGGPWVVRSVLDLARRGGFEVIERPTLPLPEEAVDAETPLGREVLRYLPMARTELALRVLLAQEEAWHVGATLVSPLLMTRATQVSPLQWGEGEIRGILADRSLHWLLHPPRVAIVGAPNVGKSTLANRLFAQERSITADAPGTTRDWVGEIANVDGLAVMLVDTPGLRNAPDAIEREAIARGRVEINRAELVVLVADRTMGLDAQRELIDVHPDAVRVMNKCDLPGGPGEFTQGWIHTVATTGDGVNALRQAITRRFLGLDQFNVTRPRWWTERQRVILERAMVDASTLREL